MFFSRSNFLGTHFTTYDSGESPSHSGFTLDVNNMRRELVAVAFVCLPYLLPLCFLRFCMLALFCYFMVWLVLVFV